jgi:hypothetical protein
MAPYSQSSCSDTLLDRRTPCGCLARSKHCHTPGAEGSATVLIILAAVFVALDKREFGATAEKHRAAEFNTRM